MNSLDAKHFLLEIRLLRERIDSFDEYPFCLPFVRKLDILTFHPGATFLVGENGSGKSTLLEAIAALVGLNPEGGSRNFNFVTRDSLSTLHRALRISQGIIRPADGFFLRAESFFNLASEIERLGVELAYGGIPLHELSHGESFMSLFQNRFRGRGLYLLDEPEAALSPVRQMSFLTIMNELIRRGSQFIIATHSPIIMAYPDSWIYSLGDDGVRRAIYEETEHYRITKFFLNHTDRMLRELLEE